MRDRHGCDDRKFIRLFQLPNILQLLDVWFAPMHMTPSVLKYIIHLYLINIFVINWHFTYFIFQLLVGILKSSWGCFFLQKKDGSWRSTYSFWNKVFSSWGTAASKANQLLCRVDWPLSKLPFRRDRVNSNTMSNPSPVCSHQELILSNLFYTVCV